MDNTYNHKAWLAKQSKSKQIKPTLTKPTVTIVKDKIKNVKDITNAGIILMDDNVMQAIRTQSGPLAPSCEYQVHYWALIIRSIAPDKSILDICIPTTFFNYKQEVTGAHIDFELEDVDSISNELLPVHNMKVNELIIEGGIVDQIKALLPQDRVVTLMSTNLNSIHKHPGGHKSQSFSGTDLRTSHLNDTGIVFPLAEGIIKPNFAGIMAHDKTLNKVAHFEYRIANGKVGPLNTDIINYFKGRCVCIVRADETRAIPAIPEKPVTATESLMGIPNTPAVPAKPAVLNDYVTSDSLTDIQIASNVFISNLKSAWKATQFDPFTDTILPENVAKKEYQQHSNIHKGLNKPKKNKALANDYWSDYYNSMLGYGADIMQDDMQDDIPSATPDYMDAISKIEWLSNLELQSTQEKDLLTIINDLEAVYYEREISTTAIQYKMTKVELIKEYQELKESICDDMDEKCADDASPIIEGSRIITRSDIIDDLKTAGSDMIKINIASFNALKLWHKAIFK